MLASPPQDAPAAEALDQLLDAARLRAVRALGRPAAGDAFDRVAGLLRRLLDVPAALVTVVDALEQRHLGIAGALGDAPLPRALPISHSFCRHAVLGGERTASADPRHDPRFAALPAVTELGVGAYLGVPLTSADGHVVGAVCALDDAPRTWSPEAVATVEEIATIVTAMLRRRGEVDALRLAVAATHDLLYVVDLADDTLRLDGAVTEWHAAAEPLPATMGAWHRRVVDARDRERVASAWTTAVADPRVTTWEAEYRARRPDGTIRRVRDRARVHRDAAGRARLVAGALSDVTAERTAHEALETSDLRLRRVLDTIRDGVVLQDRHDVIHLANPAAGRILGLTEDQLFGRSSYDPGWAAITENGAPMTPDTHPSIVALRTGVAQTDVVMGVCRSDGSRVWLAVDAVPMLLPDPEATESVVVTFRDITAEREAALVAARLAAIVSSATLPVISLDADGTVRSWNDAAVRWSGRSAADAVGRPFLAHVAPAHRAVLSEQLAAVAHGERLPDLEVECLAADGAARPVLLTLAPIRDGASRPVGVSLVLRDIARQRQLELELRQSQKLEALGRLASGVAHDFNNMLAAISAAAELCLADTPADAPIRADLDEIVRAADRAAGLTRQMLAFARKQVAQPRPMRLDRAIGEMSHMLRCVVGEVVPLVFAHDESQPTVLLDPVQVEQVLLNLVVNARDAMPIGGTITVETRGGTTGRLPAGAPDDPVFAAPHVLLAVRDTGTGMDAATIAHVFEPFFTTKEEGRGTGLGLSTVYGIVRQVGGAIWIESAPGEGTTMSIAFPAEAVATPVAPVAAEAPPVRRLGGVVLVVDDDPAVLRSTRRTLEHAGLRVYGADSAASALAVWQALRRAGERADAVVTDLTMPVMTGLELVRVLRRDVPRLPAVILSGDLHAGGSHPDLPDVHTLAKPWRAAELLELLGRVLR